MNYAIEVQNAWKIYRQRLLEVQALRGLSLKAKPGEMIAITGPSGSGKSTLLHLLGALDTPSKGSVKILGQDISKMSDNQLATFRRQQLGFVFQFFNLLPTLTAQENAALPLLLDGVPRSTALQNADRLLQRVGLGDRLQHRPDELSGGQQQRVALARALVAEPKLLLADEPTGNLDSKASETVLNLLEELRQETQITMILVTHDDRVAARAKRNLHLIDGQIAEDRRRPKNNGDSP
ncbi:MAG: ABC transporter ATP-binding protein [Planctomycetota bacterium]|nr:ABC transporter ATP-binding protein [Planctomycetota bacterium]